MSDEEIQKQFETNDPPKGTDRDTLAYREIFRVVSKEPALKIKTDFAGSVVKKIVVRKKREARRDMIWLSFGVVFLLTGLFVTAAFAGLKFDVFSGEIFGLFIFGVAITLAFNWIEKRALPKPTSNR